MPSLPVKIKILLVLAKKSQKKQLNFSRGALFHMKTGASLKYFVTDCRHAQSNPKQIFISLRYLQKRGD